MIYYIIDNVSNDVIATGFNSEDEAKSFIRSNSYLKQYWYRYEVKTWPSDLGYAVTSSRSSVETGKPSFLLFSTYEDALAYACDNPFALLKDFDFDSDIYQVNVSKRNW